MATAAAAVTERQASPNPAQNLSSRNPFRPLASPSLPTYNEPTTQEQKARMAKRQTNPFLDASEVTTEPKKLDADIAADIFNDLSLLDKPAPKGAPPVPPQGMKPRPPPGHRPSGSDERRDLRPMPGSPRKGPSRRPRGMSESSVMDSSERERLRRERGRREREGERPPRTESEERRRRERRREREERYRREKERMNKTGEKPKDGSKKTRSQRGLDIIDKLDVTGIYGQGFFHHDGPFDACNPHRNKKHHQNAPMHAFPSGSANMALGGAGPLNNRLNLDLIHGRGEEGFEAFNSTRKNTEVEYFHPTMRAEPVHGAQTDGLGTSTFLEGAPASRRDLQNLQRRESEDPSTAANSLNGGGLQRKKSLAQRLRGASQSRHRARAGSSTGDGRTPDARYVGNPLEDSPPPPLQTPPLKAQSAGGPVRANMNYTRENEVNPFDNDYEAAYDNKGAQIKVAEQSYPPNVGRTRATSSPKGNPLVRSVTADATGHFRAPRTSDEQESSGGRSGSAGGGFLNRMRSLKGGRRPRAERRDS